MKKTSLNAGFTSASELLRKFTCIQSERRRSKLGIATNAGFTLVEIMTSLSIFIVVVTISMGAILSVYDASRRARVENTLMANLNIAVETMTREIRFGRNYHCGDSVPITSPENCTNPDGDSFISFMSSDDVQITYKQTGTAIQKRIGSGDFLAETTPEVVIESLRFYVVGAEVESSPMELQPRVLIKIKGRAGVKNVEKGEFSLQTMVSQRKLDNGL